jgi:hypothetical protein
VGTLILAACGGGGATAEEWRTIRGEGYAARVPAGWELERPPRTVAAANPDGPETVSIGVFRLSKPFDAALWSEAVAELNDVAARLAERLSPTARVERSRDGILQGRRGRFYEIRYRRDDVELVDRVVFLLVDTREYQLTCRIAVAEPGPGTEACAELHRSFRLRPPP